MQKENADRDFTLRNDELAMRKQKQTMESDSLKGIGALMKEFLGRYEIEKAPAPEAPGAPRAPTPTLEDIGEQAAPTPSGQPAYSPTPSFTQGAADQSKKRIAGFFPRTLATFGQGLLPGGQ